MATNTVSKEVVNSDDGFFERFAWIHSKMERTKQDHIIQLEDLYIEVLYTIQNKVGVAKDEFVADRTDLKRYAQDAFQVSDEEHARMFKKACQEKPPAVIMNVVVIEAENIISKDVNGLSDPYCMLGIIPGKRRLDTRKKSEILEDIPAKLIKASSVQKETLDPVWNEKFQFNIENPKTDKFHLDIWDHDDEASVVDAVKKLNEVSGVKGLSRFFKQVAQSARTDEVDDFIGCIDLDVSQIPSTGKEMWLELEGRTSKSKVSGRIKLKVWLGTREEREDQDEDDNLVDIKEHQRIIQVFTEYELRQCGSKKWNEELPQEAMTILHQHAIQGDITPVQQHMTYWLAYNKIHESTKLSYSHLYKELGDLLTAWKAETIPLDKEEEDMLAESFAAFLTHCYDMILKHRTALPYSDPETPKKLEYMLRSLSLLHSSELFKKCLPFQQAMSNQLQALLKKSAIAYFERAKYSYNKALKRGDNPDSAEFSRLAHLFTIMNAACLQSVKLYHNLFNSIVNIDYFMITYREFDRLASTDCHSDVHKITRETLLPVFELYLALVEFISYRDQLAKDNVEKLREWDQTRWFEAAIKQWIHLAKEKGMARIDLACKMDKKIDTKYASKQSTSTNDVCITVRQMIEFWERVEIPNPEKYCHLTELFVTLVCGMIEYYSDARNAHLGHFGFFDRGSTAKISDDQITQVCIILNNVEMGRRLVTDMPDKLHFDLLYNRYEKQTGVRAKKYADKWLENVNEDIENLERNITLLVDTALYELVEKRSGRLQKHIFHLVWSPTGIDSKVVAKPLMEQLEGAQTDFHKWLLHRNFIRFLLAQLKFVANTFQKTIDENPGQDAGFYRHLYDAMNILVDHAVSKGIEQDSVQKIPKYKKLIRLLSLNKMGTKDLINAYFSELIAEQEEATESPYGSVQLRGYYNDETQTLVVDIVSAKNIIPLDKNGLSDPFIILELVPPIAFPDSEIVKTKVVYKTLNPTFDETFNFSVPRYLPTKQCMLHLIVMDQDFLMSNDFAGECFLDIQDVPGFGDRAGRRHTIKEFNLILIHPTHQDLCPLSILDSRKEDDLAQEFVQRVESIRNV